MGRLPDLTALFWFAAFGMLVAAGAALGGGAWLCYHLFRALSLYLGAGAA